MARQKTIEAEPSDSTPVSIAERAIAARDAKAELTVGGKSFRVKKAVTLPTLKQDTNDVTFTVLSEMYTGRVIKPKDGSEAPKEAATLVKVLDLMDGRAKVYVVNAVLKSEWTDNPEYENGQYVGRSFAVRKLARPAGKRHRELEIVEIEPDGDDTEG